MAVLSPAKQSTTTTTVANAQVFYSSWSATAVFTVTGKPYLQGNRARIVPNSQTAPAPPISTTTTPITPATSSPSMPDPPVLKRQQQRYMFIGKPLKAW